MNFLLHPDLFSGFLSVCCLLVELRTRKFVDDKSLSRDDHEWSNGQNARAIGHAGVASSGLSNDRSPLTADCRQNNNSSSRRIRSYDLNGIIMLRIHYAAYWFPFDSWMRCINNSRVHFHELDVEVSNFSSNSLKSFESILE
jgi:hypothetical protein